MKIEMAPEMVTDLTPEEIARKLYRYDKIATKLPRSTRVGEREVAEYRAQGYLALEAILSQEEVDAALDAIVDIIQGNVIGPKVQFTRRMEELTTELEKELATRKISEFVDFDPRLRHVAYHPIIINAVETLLGGKAKLVQDQALLKPPHGGQEKPWHQDMAYGALTWHKAVIGVWVALDEADLDNGCMHIIPRSHMAGATPHYAVRDWQLCDTMVPIDKDVAVTLKPGGLLFFHGLLYHGTPPNQSSKRRRALQFHYTLESAEKMDGKQYKRFFTNALTEAEC